MKQLIRENTILFLFVFFGVNAVLFGAQDIADTNRHVLSIDECPVCFESITAQRPAINTGVCRHCFCQSCLNRLTSCAICRAPLRFSLLDQMMTRQLVADRLHEQLLRWLQAHQRIQSRNIELTGQELGRDIELLGQQSRSQQRIRRLIFRLFSRRLNRVSPLHV